MVEVVSPDDPDRDLVEKRADYAEAGISEYRIADPRDATITVLSLRGDTYVEHGSFARGSSAGSPLLEGFSVDVAAVFDAPQLGT
ncbi:MAG: Uma2 family endonuclease [Spirochaetaceae bacterium]|nr:Uma2 family endonuclease [Spirochaetaceae bacterium]